MFFQVSAYTLMLNFCSILYLFFVHQKSSFSIRGNFRATNQSNGNPLRFRICYQFFRWRMKVSIIIWSVYYVPLRQPCNNNIFPLLLKKIKTNLLCNPIKSFSINTQRWGRIKSVITIHWRKSLNVILTSLWTLRRHYPSISTLQKLQTFNTTILISHSLAKM